MEIKRLYKIFSALAASVLLMGCTELADGPDMPDLGGPDDGAQSVEVPVYLAVSGQMNTDGEEPSSRALPPGVGGGESLPGDNAGLSADDGMAELAEIDIIRVVTFRRKDLTAFEHMDPDSLKKRGIVLWADDYDGFEYDAQNSLEIKKLKNKSDVNFTDAFNSLSHNHKVGVDSIKKIYGYQYRIVALAYNKAVADANMKLNLASGLKLKDFTATFTNSELDGDLTINGAESFGGIHYYTNFLSHKNTANPQLFWGYCHLEGDDSPIINYSNGNDEKGNAIVNSKLTGILYRGMAKVELKVKMHSHQILWSHEFSTVGLMANDVLTKTCLYSYDCFNRGTDVITGNRNNYTVIAQATKSAPTDSEGYITLSAWLLPGKVALGLRCKFDGYDFCLNGRIMTDNVSYGDMATGVISPDAHNNIFYLRRNHKYVFKCDNSETILKHEDLQ